MAGSALSVRTAAGLLAMAALLVGCGTGEPSSESGPATSSDAPSGTGSASTSTSPTRSSTTRSTTSTTTRTTSSTSSTTPPPSLAGDTRNAWAFAPLNDCDAPVEEGQVPSLRAWSTSKVLVVAAFLDTVAGGDPGTLSASDAGLIERTLTESHMDSLLALRARIPGGSGPAITAILRGLGDTSTTAPSVKEGTMPWGLTSQVRFLCVLDAGEVVSPAASAYILQRMHPIDSQAWGLATIDADAVKGGWLLPETETRQMGIVDGYAVAIITAGVGPALLQSDGDYAHVEQMNALAASLRQRLTHETKEAARD